MSPARLSRFSWLKRAAIRLTAWLPARLRPCRRPCRRGPTGREPSDGRALDHLGDRVRGFERREDAFELRAQLEGGERLLVRHRHVGYALHVVQPRVLGPDTGIIEAGRDRMRLGDLA